MSGLPLLPPPPYEIGIFRCVAAEDSVGWLQSTEVMQATPTAAMIGGLG